MIEAREDELLRSGTPLFDEREILTRTEVCAASRHDA